jgi:hypothetical protein
MVFGKCYNCKEYCATPPIKIPAIESLRWSEEGGQIEIEYRAYCTKGTCITVGLAPIRAALKEGDIRILGEPVK